RSSSSTRWRATSPSCNGGSRQPVSYVDTRPQSGSTRSVPPRALPRPTSSSGALECEPNHEIGGYESHAYAERPWQQCRRCRGRAVLKCSDGEVAACLMMGGQRVAGRVRPDKGPLQRKVCGTAVAKPHRSATCNGTLSASCRPAVTRRYSKATAAPASAKRI